VLVALRVGKFDWQCTDSVGARGSSYINAMIYAGKSVSTGQRKGVVEQPSCLTSSCGGQNEKDVLSEGVNRPLLTPSDTSENEQPR